MEEALTEAINACQWEGCEAPANHVVTVDIPEGGGRVWHVCSAHDTDVKVSVVRSRPRPAPVPGTEESSVTAVYCLRCGIPLDEPSGLPTGERLPCPICGSTGRAHKIGHFATLGLEGHLTRRWKRGRTAKTRRVVTTGDDFTHHTQTWGTKTADVDPTNDTYREEIMLHDGTRIETSAKLSDHWGHGSAKRSSTTRN